MLLVPFELLFQVTMLGGARDDARHFYGQIVSELETIVGDYLSNPNATVADTLMATSRVYDLFQSAIPTDDSMQQVETPEEQSENDDDPAANRTIETTANADDAAASRRARIVQCVERSVA